MLTLLLTVCLHAEPPKAHPLAPKGFDPRIDEAQSLRTKGLRGDALDLLGVVELEARKKKDPVSEGRALQKRGDLQLDVHDCKGSKASYEAALEVLGKADPIASGQTWNDLGIWAKSCASPQEQRVFFGNALGIYEELRDQKGIRKVANNLGTANFNGGDKSTAIGFFKKAAKAARVLGDDEGLATGLANLALMELLLSEERIGTECLEFTKTQRGDRGFQRAVAAFREAEPVALRLDKPPVWLCAKFGIFSDMCEGCLIKR